MVSVELKDTKKAKIRRRKEVLLAARKSTRDLTPEQHLPRQQNWGSFKPRVHVFMKGREQRGFSIELGRWSTESKLSLIEVMRGSIIIPASTWCGPYFLQTSKTCIRLFSVSLEDKASVLSLNRCFLTASPFFLHSLTSPKIIHY